MIMTVQASSPRSPSEPGGGEMKHYREGDVCPENGAGREPAVVTDSW